ncbi:MAG: alpha/beta hydrolase [Patescibacteria group bacterium]
MKTAILIHGMPGKEEFMDPSTPAPSNNQWFPWIQKQLSLKGIVAQTPEMPEPYRPDYEKWKQVFEQFELDEETILVGHSCGGGFLVRWLSENDVKVGKVVLVAPWINPNYREIAEGFFDFKVDPNLASKTRGLTLFISSDDDQDELDTAKMLEEKIQDIKMVRFTDKGHFCVGFNMKTEEFPELLAAI